MILESFGLLKFLLTCIAPPILMALPADADPPDPTYPTPPDPGDPGDDGGESGGGGLPYISNSGSRALVGVSATSYGGNPGAQYKMSSMRYDGNTGTYTCRKRTMVYKNAVQETYTLNGSTTSSWSTWASDDNGQTNPVCQADNNQYSWRARVNVETTGNPTVQGTLYYFKTAAIAATSSAPVEPTGANLEATQAYISVSCYPNTLHSVATLQLQYRESGGSWTNFGTSASAQGYSEVTIGRQLTGLTPETQYEVRLQITRDTVNNTSLTSSTTSFTTLADTPDATTSAATSVSGGAYGVSDDGSANLNGTVDRNTQTDAEWRFAYGKTSSALDLFTTWTATTSEPETVQASVTGLDVSTTYYFQLEVRWNSGTETTTGDELSFDVPASPGENAAKEALMIVYEYDAIQGEDKKVYFSYRDIATSSSDRFLTTAPATLHGAADGNGDVLIYIDGAVKSTNSGKPDNNITQVGSTSLYYLTLDGDAELTGEDVVIQFVDTDGPAFRDFQIHVRTKIRTSSLICDASQGLTNESGLVAKGQGSGHGIEAVGGASGNDIDGILANHVMASGTVATYTDTTHVTLDAGAVGTADYYNGAIILFYENGTGAGQARTIVDYTAGKAATLNKALNTAVNTSTDYVILPGPDTWNIPSAGELSALPSETSNFADMLLFLFQRFAFKRTQNATTFTMYDSGGDAFASNAVDDDGTTQTHNKMS